MAEGKVIQRVILWTIQSKSAFERLNRSGALRADPDKVIRDYLPVYRWMAEQMRKRLGTPSSSGALPIWAWYQWCGNEKCRPDLRSAGHLESGSVGVRIEFQSEPARALLSDFGLWHFALNYWYLPRTVKEGKEFEARLKQRGLCFYRQKPLPSHKYHQLIERSWCRIFDLSWRNRALDAMPLRERRIQATLWELKLESVQKVTWFVAR